jgi:hypothetical protein
MNHSRCVRLASALAGCWLATLVPASAQNNSVTKTFAPGGRVRVDLSAGAYSIVAGRDDQILVRWTTTTPEEMASVKVDVQVRGIEADVTTAGPRNHFEVTIELPAQTDLDVKMTAGDLRIGLLKGNRRVESWAGRVDIDVGRAEDYASVQAKVTAGEIVGGPFSGEKGGLFRSLSWKGPGKYTIDVRLTAGDIRLR